MERRQYLQLKYRFTDPELNGLREQLAQEIERYLSLENQKAAVVASLAGEIKTAKATITDLTHKANQGYEMRPTEVLVLLDTPIRGMKRYVRIDTHEQAIEDEPMTEDELQQQLDFPESER